MLNDNLKRALYESIMKDVAKVVKKHLNKLSESEEKSNNSFVESFILSLSKMNESNLIKLKRAFRRNLNESVDTAAQMIQNDLSSFTTLDWDILDTASNPTPYDEISYGFKTQAIESSSIQPDATKYDSKLFVHHDWPFAINSYIDDVEYLDIIVPNEIKNDFIKDMSQHELYHKEMPVEISHNLKYILSNPLLPKEYKDILSSDEFKKECENWSYIRFLPVYQKDIRTELKQHTQYLYHYTLDEYVDDILKNGMKCNNLAHPTYPKRIFLITPYRDENTIERLKWKVKQFGQNIQFDYESYCESLLKSISYHIGIMKNSFISLKFSKIAIDLNKVPENVKFHWDVNSLPFGVFTETDIPAEAVSFVEKVL